LLDERLGEWRGKHCNRGIECSTGEKSVPLATKRATLWWRIGSLPGAWPPDAPLFSDRFRGGASIENTQILFQRKICVSRLESAVRKICVSRLESAVNSSMVPSRTSWESFYGTQPHLLGKHTNSVPDEDLCGHTNSVPKKDLYGQQQENKHSQIKLLPLLFTNNTTMMKVGRTIF
jgi:hypothetical protein